MWMNQRKELTSPSWMLLQPPAHRSAYLWCWWCKELSCLEKTEIKNKISKKKKKVIKYYFKITKTEKQKAASVPVATGRTSSDARFTRGLKEVLLSPLPPPPPPNLLEWFRSCRRSSGPFWRRTRESDSSSAWISDTGMQIFVVRRPETKLMRHNDHSDAHLSAFLC